MKKSTIDWAPFIPKEWEEKRIKDIAHLQSGDGITSDDIDEIGLYPVYGGNGLRGYTDTYTNDGSYVLIGRQGALCGNINYAKNKFYASEHAVVVYPYCKEENTTWLGETLRAANLNRLSASAAQPGLAVSALNFVMIPYPPKSQRERIGKYLQEKIPLIDTQVVLLEKKKDAYTRLKKAMINRAVTRGLDEHVKLKDSGVEWIGMIPEHWEVKRGKDIGKITHGVSFTPDDLREENDGVLIMRASNIQNGQLSYYDKVYVSSELIPRSKLLKKNDIIICGTNGSLELVGKSTIIKDDINASYGSFMLRFQTSQNASFIHLQLSQLVEMYRGLFATTTINQLTISQFQSFLFSLPPLSEQQAIATYLDEKSAKIDAAIANIDKQTDALKRLKRSLINEVITGQRAV